MTTSYVTGTVSVETDSRTVMGSGTGWLTANIAPGFFSLDSDDGNPVPVESVVSDTELTLFTPWRGATAAGQTYWLSYDTNDGQQTVNNAIRLSEYIARLDSASLSSIAGLTPEDQKLILFTGPNTAVLIGRDELGFAYDEQVPDLAARAQYDDRPKDFRVLVVDSGDGRSAFYIKNSNTSGDWSDALYVTGAKGDTGEDGPFTQIVGGNTTTLPAGSQATVTPRDVSPGVVALDFGVPRGENGTGTGDVVGPNGGIISGDFVQFGDGTGKLIARATTASQSIIGRIASGTGPVERLGVSQVNQMLGGWEPVGLLNPSSQTVVSITNLSAFLMLRLTYILTGTNSLSMHVSTDNGTTFLTGASDYNFSVVDNNFTGSSSLFGGGGDLSYISLGDQFTSGQITITRFNKPAFAKSFSIQNVDFGSVRRTRTMTQLIAGMTARNALRIVDSGGAAITGSLIIEGVRG